MSEGEECDRRIVGCTLVMRTKERWMRFVIMRIWFWGTRRSDIGIRDWLMGSVLMKIYYFDPLPPDIGKDSGFLVDLL
jgi:hypothetical protein